MDDYIHVPTLYHEAGLLFFQVKNDADVFYKRKKNQWFESTWVRMINL